MKNVRESAVKSTTHRKIMFFFAENLGSVDTPRGISAWTNGNIKGVRTALEDLVKDGLLRAHRTSSTVAFSCGLPAHILSALHKRLKKKP